MISEPVQTRLVMRARLLAIIDRRRVTTGDPSVGRAIEKQILDLELRDLERTMAADVGPAVPPACI